MDTISTVVESELFVEDGAVLNKRGKLDRVLKIRR